MAVGGSAARGSIVSARVVGVLGGVALGVNGVHAGDDAWPLFPRPTVETCEEVLDLAVADVNGDGFDDVVMVCEEEIGRVLVVFGAPDAIGERRFVFELAIGNSPVSLATGDVNGDDNVDVFIVVTQAAEGVVLLGDGAGAFSPMGSTIPLGSGTAWAILADMDGDGDRDYVYANDGSASIDIRYNDGSGLPTQGFAGVPVEPSDITGLAAIDIEGDGDLDLAYVSRSPNRIRVYRNDGGGSFVETWADSPSWSHGDLIALDVDGDTLPDLVASQTSDVGASLGRNNGDGTFAPMQRISISPDSGRTIAGGDLNGDGFGDVVVSSTGDDPIGVMYGGEAGFPVQSRIQILAGDGPSYVGVGDFNGDGRPDACAATVHSQTLSYILGTPYGDLLRDKSFFMESNADFVRCIIGADLDGDSIDEIIMAPSESGTIKIASTLDGGDLALPVPSLSGSGEGLAAGDLTGDGFSDLAFTNGEGGIDAAAGWSINDGGGALGPVSLRSTGLGPRGIALVDFDDDGDLDIVTANYSSDSISLIENQGGGFFASASSMPTTSFPGGLGAGDLDLDGFDDLVVLSNANFGGLAVHFGLEGGGVGEAVEWSTASDLGQGLPGSVRIADMNDDGYPDVICPTGAGVSIFLNDGFGGFFAELVLFPQREFGGVDVGDFDGDGRTDLAGVDLFRDMVTVWIRRGPGLAFDTYSFGAIIRPRVILATDVDGDGRDDLVVAGDRNEVGVLLSELPRACAADLALPLGELDFSDVLAFLDEFAAMQPDADLSAPLGVFDFDDVLAFLVAFGAGCP